MIFPNYHTVSLIISKHKYRRLIWVLYTVRQKKKISFWQIIPIKFFNWSSIVHAVPKENDNIFRYMILVKFKTGVAYRSTGCPWMLKENIDTFSPTGCPKRNSKHQYRFITISILVKCWVDSDYLYVHQIPCMSESLTTSKVIAMQILWPLVLFMKGAWSSHMSQI